MLNLTDPPAPPPEEHPHLRLVPKGPPVNFRLPQDPEVPWPVRAVAILLGLIISVTVVTGILFFGAFIKYVYDSIDAAERAKAAEQRAAPRGPAGSINIVIPKDQPTAPPATGTPSGSGTDVNPPQGALPAQGGAPPPPRKSPPAPGSSQGTGSGGRQSETPDSSGARAPLT